MSNQQNQQNQKCDTMLGSGIWDFMTGKLQFRLANSVLGAIITHALVNEEGTHIVAAESGELLYWNINTRKVAFQVGA